MQITHWVPYAEGPRWPCVIAWENMKLPAGCTKRFDPRPPNNVKFSWNKAVLDFLESKSEWLFSTHNDVVFDPDTLLRLLSWDKPLVSALVFMRHSPVVPHIWKAYEDGGRYVQRINDTREWFYAHRDYIRFGPFVMDPRPDDALTPVDFTSTSCTLIHRSVLEAMRPLVNDVWFQWDNDYAGGGEDRRFFENAKLAGFPAFVDRSCVAGHLMDGLTTSAAEFIAWDSVSEYKDTGEPVA